MNYYLIYVSSSVGLMDSEGLYSLLEQSREKNQALGITGMLLYKEGNFIQLIEGEKAKVIELFNTIKMDDRHKNVIALIERSSKKRIFPDWSMGFYHVEDQESRSSYTDYFSKTLNSAPFDDEVQFVKKLFVSFNKNNY